MTRILRRGTDHFVTDNTIDAGLVAVKSLMTTRDARFPVFVKVCPPQVTVKSSATPS